MNEKEELFIAKLSAILNLLWGVSEITAIGKIARAYTQHKQLININLEKYLKKEFTIDLPDSWLNALESNSIFYSFCYGLFKLVPATILSQGFPVAILMSEELKFRQSDYFMQLAELHLRQNEWSTDIRFLSHRDENLLFKMKTLINSGYKIIFFIDGNKGIEQSLNNKNLYEATFKQSQLLFHQGFAWLNYLYKIDVIHGLIITSDNNDIRCSHLINTIESNLSKQTFITSVMSKVINNLDSLIQVNNVYKWDALLSVYKWIKPQDVEADDYHLPISRKYYSAFRLSEDECYLLEHKTFKVRPIDRVTYNKLKFEL